MISGTVTLTVNNVALNSNIISSGTTVNVKAVGQAIIGPAQAGDPVSYKVTVTVDCRNTTGASCALYTDTEFGIYPVTQQQQTITVNPPSVVAESADSFYIVNSTVLMQGLDQNGVAMGLPISLYNTGGFVIGDPDDLYPMDYIICTGLNMPAGGCAAPSPAQGERIVVAEGATLGVSGGWRGRMAGHAVAGKAINRTGTLTVQGPTPSKNIVSNDFTLPEADNTPNQLTISSPKPGEYTATLVIQTKVQSTPQTDPACKDVALPSVSYSWTFTVVRPSSSSSSGNSSSSESSSRDSSSSQLPSLSSSSLSTLPSSSPSGNSLTSNSVSPNSSSSASSPANLPSSSSLSPSASSLSSFAQ